MQKIRCVVERITYQNPENGYSVLKCRVKDYSELVPVVGNLIDANVGSVLVCGGSWKIDPRYGRQFMAESWEETLPATVYGMEKYLGSGLMLTPMQRGAAGATNLNLALQAALNPPEHEVFLRGRGNVMMPKECLRRSGYVFRTDDKVMQVKNNYDKDVFNGDIGIIESVNETDRTLAVNFDGRRVEYDVTELEELVHAYATTIHKSQGSEYPIVVMPVMMNHFVMLQRNLLYTGITRAKKALVIVGTKKALAYAVKNVTVTKRNSLLKERLA